MMRFQSSFGTATQFALEASVSNKKAPSGKAYIEIARRILGENVEVTIHGRKKEGFFGKIKSFFTRK